MPSDAAPRSSQPVRIEVPDQLQQTQRPPASSPSAVVSPAVDPRHDVDEARPPRDGILGQLETERAHD